MGIRYLLWLQASVHCFMSTNEECSSNPLCCSNTPHTPAAGVPEATGVTGGIPLSITSNAPSSWS